MRLVVFWLIRVRRIMAITSAFQADDVGSIPIARFPAPLGMTEKYAGRDQNMIRLALVPVKSGSV